MAKKQLIHNKYTFKLKSILMSLRVNYLGLTVGVLFYCLSLTPSLLPRATIMQGLISGVSLIVGYGLGVLFSYIYRKLGIKEVPYKYKKFGWYAIGSISLVAMFVFSRLHVVWQNQISQLITADQTAVHSGIRIFLLAVAIASIILLITRLLRKLNRYIYKWLDKWMPLYVARIIGLIVLVMALSFLVNGVMFNGFKQWADSTYKSTNNTTPEGVTVTQSKFRSGGPGSLVSWDSLGYQGQAFIGNGVTVDELSNYNSSPADEPIRVYAGLKAGDTATIRAELALQELIRTGAFDREVLIAATATGTGWIEPSSVNALEYMYNGNTAFATIQYSYLPSWMATLVDKDLASEAGRIFFDTVHEYWKNLPDDNRPKLIAYGLSLGSYGSQAAFSGQSDIASRTDGALFMGTPSFTELWLNFTNNRDSGSPEVKPIYKNNEVVGFAATHEDIEKLNATTKPYSDRVLYMQHGSDPVVWWNPNLLTHKPDWLNEPRAPDVMPNFKWYPFVTFIQVSVDQFVGVNAPNGYGHNYGNTVVAAWEAVTKPSNWTAEDTARLGELVK